MANQELVATIRGRYQRASTKDKGRVLDEFTTITCHHRKHGIRLLAPSSDRVEDPSPSKGQRVYDEAVIVFWEAADLICRKRLQAAMPHVVEAMGRYGLLHLDLDLLQRLLAASAATDDRLLKLFRAKTGSRRKRRLNPGRHISVRTFADWHRPSSDFLEIDPAAHCGDTLWGFFIDSLVATDVYTGWTEAVPLLAGEQSFVVAGLEAVGKQIPFPLQGIDSDHDSVFINETLTKYCADRGIEFDSFQDLPEERCSAPSLRWP